MAETFLDEILAYLNSLENPPTDDIEFYSNLKKILIEDKDLLERLAE